MRRERDRRLRGSVSLSLEKVRWTGGTELCLKVAHLDGLSNGWSVITRYSKVSAALSTALTRSAVRSFSVISALSLIVVAQRGSLA